MFTTTDALPSHSPEWLKRICPDFLNRTEFFDQPIAELAMPKTPVSPRTARSVQLETSLTAPFEVAGFNPVFNDDATKFTVDLLTPECHLRFDQIVANLRNSGQAVDLKYDLKDEDVGMVATITCPELPETGPTDQNSAKEFTKFTEVKAKPQNELKKHTPAEGARSKEGDTMRVAINDNHLDGTELDPVETAAHFGAETAFHLASVSPDTARRRALNGETYDLIKQPNGNYLVKAVGANSAEPQTEGGEHIANYEDWRKAVKEAYPEVANQLKFKGRVESGTNSISAEVPGDDRSYGVYYPEEEYGVVFGTNEASAGTYDHGGIEKPISGKKDESGTLSDAATGWLHAYQWGVDSPAGDVKNPIPSDDVIKELSAFVGKSPVKLYRAVYPDANDAGKLVESWTRYEEYASVLVQSNAEMGKKMKIISQVFQPADIIVDTTKLPKKFHNANDSGTQAEVIIALGSLKERMAKLRAATPAPTKENAFSDAKAYTNRKGLTESFQINQDTRAPVYRKHLRTGNTSQLIGDSETSEKLEAGVYHAFKDFNGNTFFERKAIRSDELLRFEDGRREHVLDEIRQFWSLRENFAALGLGHKRGVLMFGPPGGGKSCHARDSGIMMYDGSVKMAQDVQVGDLLMGDDSTPREVLELVTGEEEMYRFTTFSGETFTVNAGHFLHLERLQRNSGPINPVTREREPYYLRKEEDVRVRDYLEWSANKKHHSKLMKQPITAFEAQDHAVPPYLMGLLLGDGCMTGNSVPRVYSADKEIGDYIQEFVSAHSGLHYKATERNGCVCYAISCTEPGASNTPRGATNWVKNELRDLGVYGKDALTKFIPDSYKFDSWENRLHLLAGLIDTDGHYKDANCGFEYMTSSKQLAEDVRWLARSLGFHASMAEKTINSQHVQDHLGYRVQIFGDLEQIPTRLPRKQARSRISSKNPLRYGIKSVESVGKGQFYGFNVSDNHLYLDENFFVHHNCIIKQVVEDAVNSDNVVIYPKSLDGLASIIREFRDVEPDRHILCVLEDVDGLIQYSEHSMLELFDGDDQVNHVLFLATTNYPDRLPPRVMRSGRFDTKIEIKQIPREGRIAYLQSKVGTRCKPEDIENYADLTEDFSFAQMREFVAATFALNQEPKAAVARIRRNFTESRTSLKEATEFAQQLREATTQWQVVDAKTGEELGRIERYRRSVGTLSKPEYRIWYRNPDNHDMNADSRGVLAAAYAYDKNAPNNTRKHKVIPLN